MFDGIVDIIREEIQERIYDQGWFPEKNLIQVVKNHPSITKIVKNML